MINAVQSAPAFINFERSRPHQVREALAARPIAYVPLGALEWHGEHAALGLDGIKAQAICERAARISGGVVFPAMHWGAFNTMRFAFTFHFGRRALRLQVRRTLRSLGAWGFKSIVLLSGHYPLAQINMLRRECRRASRRYGAAALGLPEQALALDLGYLGDHAAKWETSLLMAIDPALVDLSRLPADTGGLEQQAREQGIMGICPLREADAELGERTLQLICERLAAAALRMLDEGCSAAAEEIYAAHAAAFKHPLQAARRAFGVQSAWEIVRFMLGNIWRERHL